VRVACHQPYFLPALSFFAKWASADCLILLDELQFVRKSSKFHYANRCKMGDDKWYSIPTIQIFPQRICDIQALSTWHPESLLDRIKNDYHKAPHLGQVLEGINEQLKAWQSPRVSELNFLLLTWAGRELGIDKPTYLQSSLGISDVPDRDSRLSKLVQAVGGDTYLAGPSGPKYMNESLYLQAGLKLEVCHYTPLQYDRGAREWVAYLSVVDALCYQGEAAAQYIQARIEAWPAIEKVSRIFQYEVPTIEEEEDSRD
jgi:hypothetical protein